MEGSSEGSFSICAAESETASVAIISNYEPIVNSRRVLAANGVV